MFILAILFVLFTFNLMNVFAQSGTTFFKDARFWLTLGSLSLLILVALHGYMPY